MSTTVSAAQGGAAVGSIQVGGNVNGDIIVGNHNFKVNTNYGTIVYNAPGGPVIKRREAKPQPPRAPLDFFDRAGELAQVEQLIARGKPVAICGSDGAGKSALLRQAANGAAAHALPDGVILLEGLDEQGHTLLPGDVIQRWFDAFYLSEPPLKVTSASAQPYLSQLRPLVLLDHLTLDADQLRPLLDLFPNSPALIARPAALPGLARPIKLGPLPRADAMELFSATSGLLIDDGNRSTVDAICALLNDVPLALVRAADVIREMNLPLDQAQARLEAAPSAAGDSIAIGLSRAAALIRSVLTPLDVQVLAAAANLPGSSIDPQKIAALIVSAQAAAVRAAVEHLKALGLLHADGPRVRLDGGLRGFWTGDGQAIKDRLVAQLLRDQRDGRFADDQYCANELGHVLGAIEHAVHTQQWAAAITLSRAIDRYVALHGLWDAWGQTANRVLQSAQAAGDRSNEAWALHQLGTRAIGSDRAQAIELLKQALSVRRAIGETTAAAYTQHNLDILIPPPVPPKGGEGSIGPAGMSGAVKAMLVVTFIGVIAAAGYLLSQALFLPTLELPKDIWQEAAGPTGTVVSFTASARNRLEGMLPVTCQPSSGSTFALGQTTVNCEARNRFGLSARGSFRITVQDTTAPQVDPPQDMIVEATSSAGSRADFAPFARDPNGRVDVTCQPPAGSTFPLDKTTAVTCTATDAHGNTSTASFSITVQDTTPPQINVPSDMVVEAASSDGNTATYPIAADDKVDGKVKVVCQPSSGSTFPPGKTSVTCTATDTHNNTGRASFSITVQDTTGPQVSVPPDMTLEAASPAGSVATFQASASDLVDRVEAICRPSSGSTFPLGATTVTCTARDSRNNTGQASFSITVQDTTGPQVSVPSDMTFEASSPAGSVATFQASASDLVDRVEAVCQPPSGSTFPLDKTTPVTCTARDSHNNTGRASFSITVRDTTPPQINVPNDLTLEAADPAGSKASYSVSATDLGRPVGVSCNPQSGATFKLGTTTVTCRASDASGNTQQRQFRIIVQDTKPPNLSSVRSSRGPVYYQGAANCTPTSFTVTATATDAFGLSSVRLLYRYVPTGRSPSAWRERTMAKFPNSNVYVETVSVATEAGTYMDRRNGTIEYRVIATDPAGNTTRSTTSAVNLERCRSIE
jgi:hypothetical protein